MRLPRPVCRSEGGASLNAVAGKFHSRTVASLPHPRPIRSQIARPSLFSLPTLIWELALTGNRRYRRPPESFRRPTTPSHACSYAERNGVVLADSIFRNKFCTSRPLVSLDIARPGNGIQPQNNHATTVRNARVQPCPSHGVFTARLGPCPSWQSRGAGSPAFP